MVAASKTTEKIRKEADTTKNAGAKEVRLKTNKLSIDICCRSMRSWRRENYRMTVILEMILTRVI